MARSCSAVWAAFCAIATRLRQRSRRSRACPTSRTTRTQTLLSIKAHASSGNVCVVTQDFQQFSTDGGVSYFQPFSQSQTCGSEANGVISNFNSLSSSQKQDL